MAIHISNCKIYLGTASTPGTPVPRRPMPPHTIMRQTPFALHVFVAFPNGQDTIPFVPVGVGAADSWTPMRRDDCEELVRITGSRTFALDDNRLTPVHGAMQDGSHALDDPLPESDASGGVDDFEIRSVVVRTEGEGG